MEKTNVMRILDQRKIPHREYAIGSTEAMSAVEVAAKLGTEASRTFKTLVTVGKSKHYYVFMLPGEKTLDLKKAAKAAKEKSIEMIPQKELLPLTGYVHGGCSPIGMKKPFPTFIDSSAENHETIFFSAGKIGYQVEMKLSDLQNAVRVIPCDLTEE